MRTIQKEMAVIAMLIGIPLCFSAKIAAATLSFDNNNYIITKPIRENYRGMTLYGEVPQIKGKNIDAYSRHFNQVASDLSQLRNAYLSGFTGNKIATSTDSDNNPINIKINYDIFKINPNIVSVRFRLYSYMQGAAHPNTNFYSINYDLKNGKMILLDSIFKNKPGYLKTIAKYCINKLNKKYQQDMSGGAAPTIENYNAWNLTQNGLLISYNQFPYALGEVTCLYPRTKGIIPALIFILQ